MVLEHAPLRVRCKIYTHNEKIGPAGEA